VRGRLAGREATPRRCHETRDTAGVVSPPSVPSSTYTTSPPPRRRATRRCLTVVASLFLPSFELLSFFLLVRIKRARSLYVSTRVRLPQCFAVLLFLPARLEAMGLRWTLAHIRLSLFFPLLCSSHTHKVIIHVSCVFSVHAPRSGNNDNNKTHNKNKRKSCVSQTNHAV
jgi:hypothetical protein